MQLSLFFILAEQKTTWGKFCNIFHTSQIRVVIPENMVFTLGWIQSSSLQKLYWQEVAFLICDEICSFVTR